VYFIGNGFYVMGLWYTPLALASALVATLLIFNTILSYLILGSVITKYDIAGNAIILAAVAVIAVFGPQPDLDETVYTPSDLTSNAGEVLGVIYLCMIVTFLGVCIKIVRDFEKAYPHFGGDTAKEEIHERVSDDHRLQRQRTQTLHDKFPSEERVMVMQLLYPAVLGTFESLVQISLKSYTGFLSQDPENLLHPLAFIMLLVLFVATAATLQWLRKVYCKLTLSYPPCPPYPLLLLPSLCTVGWRLHELCAHRFQLSH
jgi:drug/metabolite transporter (DMT)-like permease